MAVFLIGVTDTISVSSRRCILRIVVLLLLFLVCLLGLLLLGIVFVVIIDHAPSSRGRHSGRDSLLRV